MQGIPNSIIPRKRCTPAGSAVVRIGAFRLVRQAVRRTPATRGNARRGGGPSTAGGATGRGVPAAHVGCGGSGEDRETPDGRTRGSAGGVGEAPIGGRQGGTRRAGPAHPAPGEIPRTRGKGNRDQSSHPRP